MPETVDPRPLTANEAAVLRWVISRLDDPAATPLLAQVDRATVAGGISTVLDLAVDCAEPVTGLADGPLPVRAITDNGEVIVWLQGGTLNGLEYAWWSDDVPIAMPSVEALRLHT